MVRINIDLPEETIRKLEVLKERFPDKSRAAQIRKAIDAYLDASISEQNNHAFGLWGDKKQDGLEYQNSLRKEWQ
ncbi:ribbon-helix-helix protein, CopG family [Photorhabdus tasmaniensis]|uniref:Ribbon-helix-helix protein CopG domain-containing protein n=1 Tax=Photorhabdus tasmaniensis TaxID=1004159 RepID=A0ABX0GHB2_9GAMM|nr:ribbon-helix-helix protein, CopG family [Photorhabdus tasmaniensis]NHB88502.1 hypothetical protein [Photorhabdus tasmaniensis]